jgi:hypothetical protein
MRHEKAQVFVNHIQNHLDETHNPDDRVVTCKICGETIDEMYAKFLESIGEEY